MTDYKEPEWLVEARRLVNDAGPGYGASTLGEAIAALDRARDVWPHNRLCHGRCPPAHCRTPLPVFGSCTKQCNCNRLEEFNRVVLEGGDG